MPQSSIHGVRRSLITVSRVGSFRAGRHGDLYAQTSHVLDCSGDNCLRGELAGVGTGLHGGGFNIGLGPFASGGGRTCTDDTASTNFLARTSGLSNHEKDAACNFIKGLETDGLITGNLSGVAGCGTFAGGGGIDALYLIATGSTGNAALNVCGTGYSLVAHGTPPFTADQGYTGVGGTSPDIDTQFDPTALSGQNWSQSNATFAAYTKTNFVSGTDYGSMGGNGSGTNVCRLYPHYSNDTFYSAVNQGSLRNNPSTTPGHFYLVTRGAVSGSAQMYDYIDATADIGNPIAWLPFHLLARPLADSNGGSAAFQGILSGALIASGITSTQEGNFNSRFSTYMASVP